MVREPIYTLSGIVREIGMLVYEEFTDSLIYLCLTLYGTLFSITFIPSNVMLLTHYVNMFICLIYVPDYLHI